MNAIEKYRQEHGLSYWELSKLTGRSYSTCYFHGKERKNISAESAVLYEAKLGIPRSELRPDLWPPAGGAESGPSPCTSPSAKSRKALAGSEKKKAPAGAKPWGR